jgi:hypothetical protein
MTILAASVLSKVSGKVLVSRQFVPLPKLRVENMLASFPKLLTGEHQHTFVETEDVRFVYQPIEQVWTILITTRDSNIIEDLETLRLFVQLIPQYCGAW